MKSTRRKFLGAVAKTVTASSLVTLDISRFAHAAGSGVIRLGLIGCGGRGTGAAKNALATGGDVKLVAVADLFEERVDGVLNQLKGKVNADQVKVSKDNRFVGFDAYEKLLASGVDAVILATPPGFRPPHFEAAAKAGVHCFLEKPVAVDAPGIRQIRAAAEVVRQKRLSAVVGLQDRFDNQSQQLMAEIAKGLVGKIRRQEAIIRVKSLPGGRQRATLEKSLGRTLSELEYQIRNWMCFTWLSGDYIVETLVSHLDLCLWATGRIPLKATGKAERREKRGQEFGNVNDFVSASFRYDDDTELVAEISGHANADPKWDYRIEGDKGVATSKKGPIVDAQGNPTWTFPGQKNEPYQEEMNQWCGSIRKGNAMSTVESAADSNLVAIMGRTAAYAGREVTWAEMQKSTEAFFVRHPKSFQDDPPALPDKFGDYVVPARAVTM